MKLKSKSFQAFALLVAAVVGYAIYDYSSAERLEKENSKKNLLLSFPSDQISSFHLRSGDTEIELQKTTDGWKMLKPAQDTADKLAANQFVEGLGFEKSLAVAMEGESVDLSPFGLDQPQGVLTVTNNAGEKTEFKIGSVRNFQGDSFLQRNNEKKVLIASSTWFSKLGKKPMEFRDKRLMRLPNAKAEKIIFERGKEKFELAKKEGQWILSAHPQWKLNQNRVRELLAMLNATEIIEYIVEGDAKTEELRKWGLLKPDMKLSVSVQDSPLWTAEFAVAADHVHRARVSQPPFVFKISPADSNKFFEMTADSFRDRSEPFDFDKNQVREIQVRVAKQSVNFKADDEKVKNLLSELSKMKVHQFKGAAKVTLKNEILLKGDKANVLQIQWGDLESPKSKSSERFYSARSSLHSESFTILEDDMAQLKLDELLKKESVK